METDISVIPNSSARFSKFPCKWRTGAPHFVHDRYASPKPEPKIPIPSAFPAASRAAFEEHGNEMGYALLLKRYVDDPRQATPEQIAKAAWDTVPPVAPLFWSFRLMVAIGMFLIVLMGTFLVLSAKHQLGERRWLLKVALWSLPLPWLAVEAGWIVAELGRQPWVIEGVLPTAVAHGSLTVRVTGEVTTVDTAGVVRAGREQLSPIVYLRDTPMTKADAGIVDFACPIPEGATLCRMLQLMGAPKATVAVARGSASASHTAAYNAPDFFTSVAKGSLRAPHARHFQSL